MLHIYLFIPTMLLSLWLLDLLTFSKKQKKRDRISYVCLCDDVETADVCA